MWQRRDTKEGQPRQVCITPGFMLCDWRAGESAADPEEERLVALDCEMCITESGFEVTRITLVNECGEVCAALAVPPLRPAQPSRNMHPLFLCMRGPAALLLQKVSEVLVFSNNILARVQRYAQNIEQARQACRDGVQM